MVDVPIRLVIQTHIVRRRNFLCRAAALAFSPLFATACAEGPMSTESTRAQQRRNIETDFYAALERSYLIVPESRNLIAKSVGVLAFPVVVTTDSRTGEKTGLGALRVANVFTSYYLLTGVMDGRSQRAESQAVIFLFTTFDALNRFRDSDPWRVGETVVAMPTMGADGRIDAIPPHAEVLALAFEGDRLLVKPLLGGMRIEPLEI